MTSAADPTAGHATGPSAEPPGVSGGTAAWPAPHGRGALDAVVTLPGSKSLTNRALVLAALSATPTRITAPLRARDTLLMAQALRRLGVGVADDGDDWLIIPGTLHPGEVDCGLAGTVMRFVPPLAALAYGFSRFDGDPHARTRPMGALIDGLRQAGVEVVDGDRGTLPLVVRGRGRVEGGTIELDASASSQFVSALLLAGARFDNGIQVRHIGSVLPSLPHIEMTCELLATAGVPVARPDEATWVVEPGALDLPDTVIEPDLSNAAPFLVAALVCGGSVTVPHWPSSTTQAGDALRSLLAELGVEVELSAAGLRVSGPGAVTPLVADLHDVSELTPVLAAVCALAGGESRITGVAHIRGHETDRLAALSTELRGLGAGVDEREDGLTIRPAPLHGGRWHAYADHRLAQAGAVLGLAVAGVEVDDIACTSKTMADFPGMWNAMLSSHEAGA